MAVHGVMDYAGYVRYLREHPEEQDKLFRELLIRVTGFFRDPEAFAVLQEKVIPRLFDLRGAEQAVRIWVPGCSTGEEAYSIAILIGEAMEQLGRSYPVQVFATDIDDTALDIARAGRYPASIALDVSPARLQRFFTRYGDYYEIDKNLRQMLIFAEQSVIKDPPFSRLDLVSCRNLLIYMNPELQRRVLPLFHYALNPGGYLFLGTSETVGTADDLFEPLDRKFKIFIRRDDSVSRTGLFGLHAYAAGVGHPVPPTAVTAAARHKPEISEIANRVVLQEHTHPFVVIDRDNRIVHIHGRIGKFLELPSGPPNLDVIQMARETLRGPLRTIIHRVRKQGRTVRGGAVEFSQEGESELIRFTASPLGYPNLPEGMVLIQMEELGFLRQLPSIEIIQPSQQEGNRISLLEQELAHTREALQATIEELETSNEELQSSNEELQSSNEELQSSNEELETSREELQSVNEELHTVNAELESKVEELSHANDDMSNLLASTDLGIVFLDERLRILRYTHAAARIIPMIESDVGRPLGHLAHGLVYENLCEDVEEVIRTLVQKERRIQDRNGYWYLMRIRPYHAADDRVHGAVLAFIDITQEQKLAFMRKIEDALAMAPIMVMLTDLQGHIEYANDAFKAAFGYQPPADAEELTADSATSHLTPQDREAMQRALRAGRSWRGELRYPLGGDSEPRASALLAPIHDEDGKVTHAVVYIEEKAG